ncbi:MAG: CAAX prenyl protease-related protein [Nitrospirales bacterium]|nr:MAG: CAAX prenyl protease-related protein [Nitrospirales bacterium]
MWPRILPFAVYMGFIAFSSMLAMFLPTGDQSQALELWLYPVKVLVVGGLLVFFWSRFEELKSPMVENLTEGLSIVGIGVLVYVLWVRMDWSWAIQGEMIGYNPFAFEHDRSVAMALVGGRLFGASIVVPVMEELFWRSFLIRWIIDNRFNVVPLGTFTLGSFAATVVLFGLEHNLWLAGMMAGALYNALLYRTRRLWPCILAHGLTNFMLGIHVLVTEEWQWW